MADTEKDRIKKINQNSGLKFGQDFRSDMKGNIFFAKNTADMSRKFQLSCVFLQSLTKKSYPELY